MREHVIIIGAGVTGLIAAYRLLVAGYRVTVVERNDRIGGLASSFMVEGKPVDKYYHFICKEDQDLIGLANELDLGDALHWRSAGTSCFIDKIKYPFNNPFDLLSFSPIPFSQRIRFGVHALLSQRRKSWRRLDGIPAKQWLIDNIGHDAYMAIWDPLLRIKFGPFHEDISAAWIWHRIHRVATSRHGMMGMNTYGYFEQGCFTFLERLVHRLHTFNEFAMVTGTTVEAITARDGKVTGIETRSPSQRIDAPVVVSTVALKDFGEMAPPMGEYSDRLAQIRYIDIVCVLFRLDRAFTDDFWLNVNDSAIPFNGIVQVGNLNPRPDMGRPHFTYIPFYVAKDDPRRHAGDEELFRECIQAMKIIRSDFTEEWVLDQWVFRDNHAQAVCNVGFLDIMPDYRTPIEGLYITDSSQYYPEDRTLSASARLAKGVAALIAKNG